MAFLSLLLEVEGMSAGTTRSVMNRGAEECGKVENAIHRPGDPRIPTFFRLRPQWDQPGLRAVCGKPSMVFTVRRDYK